MKIKDHPKYYYDSIAADKSVNWLEKYITHVKGSLAGKKLILEEWQKDDIIRPLFGWKHKITKLRRYSTAYVEIPRKNAKSTLAAGIALYCLMADGEKGAEVYSAAADRGQAGIIFDIAKKMIEQNKMLSKKAQLFSNSIVYKSNFYKAITSDSKTKHGFNASAIIVDELHTQPNAELVDTLETSQGSRDQPLCIYLTTAGIDTTSVCWKYHTYALNIINGIIEDDTFLPVIYTVDKEADIYDEETWKAANPGYGKIVKKSYFERKIQKLKNEPSWESTFRRLHLNQWVGAEETWISDYDWMQCSGSELQGKELAGFLKKFIHDHKGGNCFLGLDLASISDITALILTFFYEKEDEFGNMVEFFDTIPFFWLPNETAKLRSKSNDVDYMQWAREGLLILTEGNAVDYNLIKKTILELKETLDIETMGFDKWNSSQMIIDLQNEVEDLVLDPVSMVLSQISAPSKELEHLVMTKRIRHFGHPVLRWMMGNVMMKVDTNGNIRPDKGKSKNKIDGPVAQIIGLATHMSSDHEESDPNKIYAIEIDI